MARFLDRHLVLLAIIVSLSLTALTIAAVIQQGQSLRERELSELRNSAERAVAARAGAFRGQVRRAFEDAAEALRRGGQDALDLWVAAQRDWSLAHYAAAGEPWIGLPLTPTQTPLPAINEPDFALGEEQEFAAGDVDEALSRYERLTDSDDRVVRGRALLAAAACRRKLGFHLVAARSFGEAAAEMRAEPRLARFAFAAELAAVDALLEGRQDVRAAEAFTQVLRHAATQEHPARLGRSEVGMLRGRAEQLGRSSTEGPDHALLRQLERSAAERAALLVTAADLQRAFTGGDEPTDESARIFTTGGGGGRALLVAAQPLGGEARLALVASLNSVLARLWGPPDVNADWRIALRGEASGFEPLARLGDEFGGAALVPTEATMARLAAQSRRRVALLVTTVAGTTGAWALVIWMMVRAVGRQRELVRLQQRFVADVSHELKTPLALIRLLAETLRDGRVRDASRVHGYHETITRESERLTVLLDNILDFSKIESGRKQYELVNCDVAEVARQAWALFEPQLTAEGYESHLQIAPELPLVKADPAALGQLIVNLLQNAYRYASEKKYVRLAVRREGAHVAILVDDRGIGMTRTQVQRLGDSFYRVPDPRVRKQRGTGLGLAIVHHIVGAHGGRMEVTSRPGQGSTFCVRLPIER